MVNVLAERRGERVLTNVRPGLTEIDIAPGVSVTGDGLYCWDGLMVSIFGDVPYVTSAATLYPIWLAATTYHVGDVVWFDGDTWTALGTTTGNVPSSSPGSWVASNPALLTWTISGSLPAVLNGSNDGIAVFGGQFLVLSGTYLETWYSATGASWSISSWSGTFAGQTKYVVYGSLLLNYYPDIDNDEMNVFSSSNGAAWSLAANYPGVITGVYLLLGSDVYALGATTYAKAADGINFTSPAASDLSLSSPVFIVYNSYMWAFSSSSTAVYRSTNGANWSLVTSNWGHGTGQQLSLGVRNSKLIVLRLTSGITYETSDGITYTAITGAAFPTPARLFAQNGSLFCGVINAVDDFYTLE